MSREELMRKQRTKRDAEVDTSFNSNGSNFMKAEEVLQEMGLERYNADSEKNGGAKFHELDIIPPDVNDTDAYALPLYVHYNVGGNSTVLCPDFMKTIMGDLGMDIPEGWDKPCPVCAEGERLRKLAMDARDTGDEKKSSGLWNQSMGCRAYTGSYKKPEPKRYLMWVRDASSEEAEEEQAYYYLCPKSVYHDGVLEKTFNRKNEFFDLADPDEGYIFIFKRIGKGKDDTEYKGFEIEKRDYALKDEWLNVPRFNDVLNYYSVSEIISLMGSDDSSDEDTASEDTEKEIEEAFQTSGEDKATEDDVKEEKSKVRRRRRMSEEPTESNAVNDDDIPF